MAQARRTRELITEAGLDLHRPASPRTCELITESGLDLHRLPARPLHWVPTCPASLTGREGKLVDRVPGARQHSQVIVAA
jgi:hypothetical protein